MVFNLNKKTYLLITGASRGIGQTMAIEIAKKISPFSVIVLLARNMDGLQKTKTAIETSTNNICVQTYNVDLNIADEKQFAQLIANSLDIAGAMPSDFERGFILHNAGTIGDVTKKAEQAGDLQSWLDYYQVNVFSMIALNVQFMKTFSKISKLIVNLSSKCAIEPFHSMSYYCSGKAAREMYFKVLAIENPDSTSVLNYAPGAIDTDMTMYVQNHTTNVELRNSFKLQRETKTMLTAEKTTQQFLKILEEREFKSGDHIDYWD